MHVIEDHDLVYSEVQARTGYVERANLIILVMVFFFYSWTINFEDLDQECTMD